MVIDYYVHWNRCSKCHKRTEKLYIGYINYNKFFLITYNNYSVSKKWTVNLDSLSKWEMFLTQTDCEIVDNENNYITPKEFINTIKNLTIIEEPYNE